MRCSCSCCGTSMRRRSSPCTASPAALRAASRATRRSPRTCGGRSASTTRTARPARGRAAASRGARSIAPTCASSAVTRALSSSTTARSTGRTRASRCVDRACARNPRTSRDSRADRRLPETPPSSATRASVSPWCATSWATRACRSHDTFVDVSPRSARCWPCRLTGTSTTTDGTRMMWRTRASPPALGSPSSSTRRYLGSGKK
mmetsp:Transcript_17717/g.71109  ORF Transcript_17717/g.71109 Transcript_17717/m.71109 type:complete len:205 (+) Transcript_17717:126-740(+)